MTIPEIAKKHGISKQTAFNRINAHLTRNGQTINDIRDAQTKEVYPDQLTAVEDIITKRTANERGTSGQAAVKSKGQNKVKSSGQRAA